MFAKKTGVAVALMALATAAHADPVSVYGKINVSVQQSDKGAGSYSELKSNASRFGLKGDQALDAGLTLVYQLEWEVDPSDEANEKNIKARNQFVGYDVFQFMVDKGEIICTLGEYNEVIEVVRVK